MKKTFFDYTNTKLSFLDLFDLIENSDFNNFSKVIDAIDSTESAQIDILNPKNITPLMLAVQTNKIKFVEKLLQAGCNINQRGALNRTAVFYCSNMKIFELLLQFNVDLSLVDIHGNHFLFYCFDDLFNLSKHPDVLNKSLSCKNPVNLNLKNNFGATCLFNALYNLDYDAIKLFLNNNYQKIDINAVDNNGNNILMAFFIYRNGNLSFERDYNKNHEQLFFNIIDLLVQNKFNFFHLNNELNSLLDIIKNFDNKYYYLQNIITQQEKSILNQNFDHFSINLTTQKN